VETRPACFLIACETYNVDVDEALVIEDSVAGIHAAVAANIKVMGFGPPARHVMLLEAGAVPFSDMRELLAVIDQ
jgi:beta-phosphoglucomutase-like phosphatase (HAD superfamily)